MWPQQPVIYEINAWAWLTHLERKYQRKLDLGSIPTDFTEADVSGSPYCIRSYTVEPHLGGRKALAAARSNLASRGLNLLLDFVPNHVAPDHPWVTQHPEYFVQGTPESLHQD